MKKILIASAIFVVSSSAFAKNWIYSKTGIPSIDKFAENVLSKGYLPKAEQYLSAKAGVYVAATFAYREQTGQCLTIVNSIAGTDIDENSNSVVIHLDSSGAKSFNYSENTTKENCEKQFVQTISENFDLFSIQLDNALKNKKQQPQQQQKKFNQL